MKITKNKAIGDLGEDIAVKYLLKNSFSIIDRNYRKDVGEIDIVTFKDKRYYFFEVKTINISNSENSYSPEDNLTRDKQRKFENIVNIYLRDKKIEQDYSLGAIFIKLNINTKKAYIKILKNIY